MAVFFQKVPEDRFNMDADFLVRESTGIRIVAGISLLIFSIAAFTVSAVVGSIVLIIALLTLAKSGRQLLIMKINKTGFYYYGRLITTWDNFISVEFIDELPLPSANSAGVNDKFSLMLKYYKDGEDGYFGKRIPLTTIQDKSEEEIIAAIRFYYRNSQSSENENQSKVV